jgi:diguanylate cyclase (GGDEF)-like protein
VRRRHHARFAEVLQLARTESEAYQVVKRHLEKLVPGGRATVLNRNNSANKLEASTSVEGTQLAETLEGADPESCIAIRGGRTHSSARGTEELMSCEVCGAVGDNVTCVPSLVGGVVIGSVLIEHPKALGHGDADYIASSIGEASPILANLRNLSIAELRAATDVLTGLPNKRSLEEAMKRMAAQATRTASPLAAVLFDLDHFKQVNDTFGHSKGDEVLAAVGDVVSAKIRASDLVGRYGGEEFLLLLPDTAREGALEVAEKLRVAIAAIHVPGVAREITASLGVAVLPDEAGEPDELVRVADRALYSAKAKGRNRVETADTHAEPEPVPAANGALAARP